MRRLPAFLMIAALVAVLVPTTALGAKPLPPKIDSLVVSGLGESLSTPGFCLIAQTVTFHGRAYAVEFSDTSVSNSPTHLEPIPRKADTVEYSKTVTLERLQSDVIWFQARLVDRKSIPLTSYVTIHNAVWEGSGCPMEVIARYPVTP
jgi:hypothetical protein